MDVTGIEVYGRTKDYDWDPVETSSSFERLTLFSKQDSATVPKKVLSDSVDDALSSLQPDAVAIHGWSISSALAATYWCARNSIPSVLMSESTAHDAKRTWWREAIKRRIVSLHSAALVGGSAHTRYLQELGMSPSCIMQGYDVIENSHFHEGAKLAQRRELEMRADLDLPEKFFLASARFIAKKNLTGLIDAYAEYHRNAGSEAWHLVILGDGPLREAILQRQKDHNLRDYIHLPGFKQYNELPAYYGLANAFVHASTTEQWGLVVNEAMAAGLPVLVSNRCGCTPDLVSHDKNGYIFDPSKISDIAKSMSRIASPTSDLTKMGKASQAIIDEWSPAAFGEGLEAAVRTARSRSTHQQAVSVLDRAILAFLMLR